MGTAVFALPSCIEGIATRCDAGVPILLIARAEADRCAPVGAIVVAIENFTEHVASGGDAGLEDEMVFTITGSCQAPAVVLRGCGG